jgi:cytochrome c biogenesis factor
VFDPQTTAASLADAREAIVAAGRGLGPLIALSALAVALAALVPAARRALRGALVALLAALAAGEVALVWLHLRIWQLAQVWNPLTRSVTGSFAVPLWVESEKLYVWALLVALIALVVRRHADDLRPLLGIAAALLAGAALALGRPFADPLPDFFAQYAGYLQAWASGDLNAAYAAFQAAEGSRQYFYNTWYMWVHPPLLFASYGAFVASFAGALLMIARRRSSFEQTAYRWARLGYLPLTLGMLLGFPWAILAWQGEAWWWSGKVNMSIMMWLLYTAYLHGRLYLRRQGMWRVVAALAVLSFIALVLTYITTYVVPGAHSVA